MRAKLTSALSVILFCLGSTVYAQQTRVQAPDLLSTESVGPAVNTQPDSANTLEDALEQDREPVPLIKHKKNVNEAVKERRYIEHPNAAKGLIRIDKEKVYYYKVPSSEQTGAANVKIAMYEPTNLSNPNNSNVDYNNVYDEDPVPMFIYEHEWQFFKSFGKLGFTLGGGIFFAQGRGQFENTTITDRPQEKFSLLAFPLNAGLVYRMQYWDSQPIAPYFGGAVDYIAFAERRDDDQNPAWGAAIGGAPAAHFFGGIAIQLGLGARSFLDLDREYGINKIWITAEYRQYVALSTKYDFSGDAINGGFIADF